MRTIAIAAAGALALTACDPMDFSEEPAEAVETVENEDGSRTIRLSDDDEGTVEVISGAGLVIDLPEGITVYPGARVVNSSERKSAAGSSARVMMITVDSIDQIIAFYREQLTAIGVELETDEVNTALREIEGRSAEGMQVSVVATDGVVDRSISLNIEE